MAFDAFALVLAMLALGYLFQRLRALPDNAAQTLNLVVLYVCLPAAVLRYAPRLHLEPALLGVAAVPWLLLGATVLLVGALARVLGLRRDEHAVLLLTVALGNTSFLGYPLTRALIGEHALPYAVVYDQFGAFLILSTFGLWVLARYGGDAFAVILPDTPVEGAARVADMILADMRKLDARYGQGEDQKVSLSIGLYTCVPGVHTHVRTLFDGADAALYRAKENGRDRREAARLGEL
ncbi:diguanylate cyclase [Lysobacter sp. 2RAB21]